MNTDNVVLVKAHEELAEIRTEITYYAGMIAKNHEQLISSEEQLAKYEQEEKNWQAVIKFFEGPVKPGVILAHELDGSHCGASIFALDRRTGQPFTVRVIRVTHESGEVTVQGVLDAQALARTLTLNPDDEVEIMESAKK